MLKDLSDCSLIGDRYALFLSTELQSQPRHLQRILFLILILLISAAQRSLQFAASLLVLPVASNASVQSRPENNFVHTEKVLLWPKKCGQCAVCSV